MNRYELTDNLTQPLYDTGIIMPDGRSDLFTKPVGQGTTLFGAGPKHFGDTNMFLSGQLPAGYKYEIRSLFLEPIGEHFAVGSTLELIIGAKSFLTIPTSRAHVSLVVTERNAIEAMRVAELLKGVAPSATAMLLAMMPGLSFGFDLEHRKLHLWGSERFAVRIQTATPGSVVRVYLNGNLSRMVQ